MQTLCANLVLRGAPGSAVAIGVRRLGWEASLSAISQGQPFRHLYSSSARQADSPAELAQWIVKQGGVVGGIAVQPAGDGTGYSLWSSQDLEEGQQLVLLPKQCQLTYDDKSDPELLGLIEQVPRELWGARLALQVLAQRIQGSESLFASYIQNLHPHDYIYQASPCFLVGSL